MSRKYQTRSRAPATRWTTRQSSTSWGPTADTVHTSRMRPIRMPWRNGCRPSSAASRAGLSHAPPMVGPSRVAERARAFTNLTNQCSLRCSSMPVWRQLTAATKRRRQRCSTCHAGDSTGDTHVLLYHWYELGRAAFRPARAAADSCRLFFNPLNPLTHTPVGRSAVAACEVFERATRRYSKPEFGITRTRGDGHSVRVAEEVAWQTPFCRLVHFKRDISPARAARDP